MLCPNCETENRDGAKFCDECGFPLTGAIARAAVLPLDNKDEVFDQPEDADQPAPEEIAAEPDVAAASEPAGDEPVADEGEMPSGDDRHEAPADEAPSPEPSAPEAAPETDDAAEADSEPSDEQDKPVKEAPETPSATDATAAIDVDLAGFDTPTADYGERLVDSSYQPPEVNWRDGGTLQMPRVNADEAPKSKDYLASSTKKQKNTGKKVAIVVVVIAIVAAVAAFATYQMQLWGGKVIPDVTGMTESDARSVLVDDGFTVRSSQVKSDDTEGLVLIMDPSANSRAASGSEVVIHIATARTIPDIKGKKKEEAESALAAEGFETVTYQTKNSSEEEGTVLEVEPAAGTRAKSSTEVVVTVAQPFTVPDISGLSYDDAVKALTDAGFGYDVAYINTEAYPEGSIIGTEPAAGTQVTEGTYVYIQIAQARGSQLVQAASALLAPGATVTINGTNYVVESLNSVSYLGGDVVAYAITAKPFTYLFGEMLVASTSQTVSGQITFNGSNEVIAIS